MIDFGLGKLLLWSAATACAGIFITQAAEVHPAAFYTQRCDAGAIFVGHAGCAHGRSRGVGIQFEGLQVTSG
jgi:hypothetical protein